MVFLLENPVLLSSMTVWRGSKSGSSQDAAGLG
jgi:hypothetical protein